MGSDGLKLESGSPSRAGVARDGVVANVQPDPSRREVSPAGSSAPGWPSQPRPTAAPQHRRRSGVHHERRIFLLALGAGLAGVIATILMLWLGDFSDHVRWTVVIFVVGSWLSFAAAVRAAVVRPLQTLSNMQSALREGDFSVRVRGASPDDALGELILEINQLAELLREQRLGALEATALLSAVMSEIDVAVFTFDHEHRLRLVNRAGERMLAQASERLLAKPASDLGLEDCLTGEAARTLDRSFPGRSGRFGMRRNTFRQGGEAHDLLVISDLSAALREEERQAWQRLVRVLGHELNNSLAPVVSIAQSLEMLVKREPRAPDWEEDLRGGLRVISERADSLSRFMKDYSRLARLPKPLLKPVEVGPLIRGAAALEARLTVEVMSGDEVLLNADPDQIQQAVINLVRNATDAALETGGGVRVGWHASPEAVEIVIQDDGPGVSNPANLFVPFFTTKPGGSGIGLALSRQIAEGHGGTLTLANRSGSRGCEAHLRLPRNGGS
jgi:two-component system, NtrC family, nitrogen regulation sensor histidine kinase NtrY